MNFSINLHEYLDSEEVFIDAQEPAAAQKNDTFADDAIPTPMSTDVKRKRSVVSFPTDDDNVKNFLNNYSPKCNIVDDSSQE